MVNKDELKQFLREKSTPSWSKDKYIHEDLSEGDHVLGSSSGFYEIDKRCLETARKLATSSVNGIPHEDIYRSFKEGCDVLNKIMFFREFGVQGDDKLYITPFSKMLDKKIGVCEEKSLLTQLVAQEKRIPSFMVQGEISADNGAEGYHAFNVIFNEEGPFLVDNENPISREPFQSYVAPISGITKEGEFQILEELARGRTYRIRK